MKTRFATPTERDLHFVRNSNLRPEDFGQEVRIADSAADCLVLVVVLFAALAVLIGG